MDAEAEGPRSDVRTDEDELAVLPADDEVISLDDLDDYDQDDETTDILDEEGSADLKEVVEKA